MNSLIPSMNDWAAAWADAMFRACWIGGIVIFLAWGITRLFPQIPAFARSWLWRLVYLKMLVLLFWAVPVEIPVLSPVQEACVATTPSNRVPISPPESRLTDAKGATVASERGIMLPPNAASELSLSFGFWLFTLWTGGAIVCTVLLARNWLQMNRLRRSCSPLGASSLIKLNAELAEQFNKRRAPQLLKTDAAVSPQLVGVFRPTIILPTSLLQNPQAMHARMILAHELAHWNRRDLLWNWLPAMVNVLFYFHPALWLAHREWRLAQELACDEDAIQIAKAPLDEYGRLLLDIARACRSGLYPSFLTVGVSQSFRGLRRRIAVMKVYHHSSRFQNVSACALLAMGTLVGLAPWKLTAQIIVAAETAPEGENSAKNKSANAPHEEQPAVASKLPGRIFVNASIRRTKEKGETETDHNRLVAIDPNTGKWESLSRQGTSIRVSPDGSAVAYEQDDGVWLCDSARGDNPRRVIAVSGRPVWSPDGREIVITEQKSNEEDKKSKPEKPVWTDETWMVNSDGSHKTWVPVPSTDSVEDWSPDGKWFVTCSDRHPPFGSGYQLYLLSSDGTQQRRLTHGRGLNVYCRFSPDGKQVLFTHQERGKDSIRTINIEDGKETVVLSDAGVKGVNMACWAPDGNHLAILRFDWQVGSDGKLFLGDPHDANFRFEIVSLDGKERRELKLDHADVTFLGHPHWK